MLRFILAQNLTDEVTDVVTDNVTFWFMGHDCEVL